MNYSQSYIDFIEGNLAPNEELQFAQSLAGDEEFRSGFKSFMEITNSIHATASDFGPTIAETNAIYQKLGYVLPNAGNTALWLTQMGKTQLLQKPLRFLLTAIPTALVTFLATWFFMNQGFHKGNPEPVHTNNASIIATNYTEPTKDIEQPEQKETTTIVKYIYVNNYPVVDSQNSDLAETEEQNLQPSDISEISSDKAVTMTDNSNSLIITSDNTETTNIPELSYIDNIPQQIVNPQFNTLSERNKLGLSFEIRNAATWNLPKETISPSYLSKFSNMALSLFYHFNKQWAFGLDLRQETFYVKYDSYDEFNQQYIFEQQPNFVSYGLVARYSPIEFHGLKPYIQANISRNNFGVIARGNTGLQYELYPNFDLTVNLEYSYLFFNHQNTLYNGKKIGLNYGINYKF